MATKAQEILDAVNGVFGKGTLTLASDSEYKVDYIPTGILAMDILLQGGMPKGRFIEVFGDYSTLKSYVGYRTIVEVQKRGGTAAVIDTEHSFDEAWARKIGIDLSNVIVHRPQTGEEGFDLMYALVKAEIDFILVDSIAAQQPQTELEKSLSNEKIQPARLAQLMSAGLRRIMSANKNTGIMWINQTRVNIGITFGSNEAMPGGKAMPYYASYRVSMKKAGKITSDYKAFDGSKYAARKEQIGQKIRAEVVKSKLSKPFRDVWFDWNLTMGDVDEVMFLFTQGVELGYITATGNTWRYGDILKAVGRGKFYDALTESPQARYEIEKLIREYYGLSTEELVRPSDVKKKASVAEGKPTRRRKVSTKQ